MKFELAIYDSNGKNITAEYFETKNAALSFFIEYKNKYPFRTGHCEIYDTTINQEIYAEYF